MKKRNIVVKSVTFVLFGLLIASFAVWGIGDIFRGSTQVSAVAEIGDVRIEQPEFARTLSREVNRLSARLGSRFDMEQARALGVVDQVLGQMVGRALFDQKADDLGLVVTDEQIKRRITEEPAFRNDQGQFDRNRFVQTLQQSNLSEPEYVETLRRDILRQQLAGVVTEAAPAPLDLAAALYAYRAEKRVARVLRVPNASVKDLPEPDQAALEAFHKEFSSSFMAPEFRALTVARLRPEDLAAETAVSEVQLREEFEARREEFVVPERRRVEQIVLLDEAAAQNAMARFKGGANFATVAQDLTGQAPVDLGLVERDGLPSDLAEGAFSLTQGQISEPIKTGFGWHILRVVEIEPGKEPGFEAVRKDLARDVAMSLAMDSTVSIANQFDDELAAGATLDEAARSLNLEVRRIEALDRSGRDAEGKALEGLPGDRFLEVGFETAAGEDSLLTETGDGGFFVLRVDAVTPAQLRPLEEVRERVAELWRDAQRAERARGVAEALAERARRGETLEDLGEAEGYVVATSEPLSRFENDPARGFAPALPGKLFELAPGEIGTVNAPDGHLVFAMVEVRPADPAADKTEVAALRESLESAMHGDLLDQFVGTLRAEYGVEINQRVVENVLSSF